MILSLKKRQEGTGRDKFILLRRRGGNFFYSIYYGTDSVEYRNTSLIQTYKEPEEGSQMLKDLVETAKEAWSRDLGLVSIGD